MRTQIILSVILIFSIAAYAQQPLTVFERSNYTKTSTYEEGIRFYKDLEQFKEINITERGLTDSGLPLHVVLISSDADFDIASNRAKGKSVLLINNAIHPGEPDGVEASQMLARDLVSNRQMKKYLDNTLVAIIPFYNIGGALNRNTGSRTNQNGPDEKGFRGNARNFDLNRDFIKNDTRNAKSFTEIFHWLDPDVLIDTHVSNGADYQYVLTMVSPQSDKLGEPLKGYLDEQMMPALYNEMAKSPYEMTPYVNVWGSTPDKGWAQFFDAPRYSSGYAALFQTIAFQSETHMLKSFELRTKATYTFLKEVLSFLDKDGVKLQTARAEAREIIVNKTNFPIEWALDRNDSTMIEFKGYAATTIKSEVSGLDRLKYDRNSPYTMNVPYYNRYKAKTTVDKPGFYLIPQAWYQVIEAMQRNQVEMIRLERDTLITVEVYHITDLGSRENPWEGHYFHNKVTTESSKVDMTFRAGDYLVPTNQIANRYIIETLEPQATDSFFRWNFFDSILSLKEGYSSYVFEDEAIEILESNKNLKKKYEDKLANDEKFRSSASAQLRFIWTNSEHMEPSYMRYPIYRSVK
jgi:hypothetical protein